jgi:hypothetical protein
MNYYDARQRKDGFWDYSCANRRIGTYPVGYCAKYQPFDEAVMLRFWSREVMEAEKVKHEERYTPDVISRFGPHNHATKEEAYECYKKYRLDMELKLRKIPDEEAKQLQRCEICNAWTGNLADCDNKILFLCDDHLTREVVESLLDSAVSSASSY